MLLIATLAYLGVLLLAGCGGSATGVAGGTASGTVSATGTGASATAGTAAPLGTISTSSASHPVQVYFSKHPDSDGNPASVFPVARVSPDLDVATYAVSQLVAGPTAAEAAQGYFTPLPATLTGPSDCGGADFHITLDVRGATIAPGTATLRFCRALSTGGVITEADIQSELNRTLLQFSTIHSVVILTASGSCFGDESGLDLCLK
jgi:hypothetical protein